MSRILSLIFVYLASTFLIVSVVTKDNVINTSIPEIYKNPWLFNGKMVRVTGTFDECTSYTCRLCPDERALKYEYPEETNEYGLPKSRCMGVSFADKKDESGWAEYSQETNARFTTSTIQAKYFAGCSGVRSFRDQVEEGEQEIVICLHRATQLDQAQIEQVNVRRPATKGFITHYGAEELIIPDNATSNELKQAFLAQQSADGPIEEEKLQFTFLQQPDMKLTIETGIQAQGGVCICMENECTKDDWPDLEGHTWLRTPSNPYLCVFAEKIKGKWKYPPYQY